MNLNTFLFRLFSYSIYYYRAQSNLYIHSPFIFNWINELNAVRTVVNKQINLYRDKLEGNLDFIGFSNLGKEKKTTVRNRYRQTSIKDSYGKILQATASYIHASSFVELGTSLGVSTSYIISAQPYIQGTTLDSNLQTSTIAAILSNEIFSSRKVQYANGLFQDLLPEIIKKMKRLDFVFIDGDHSSDGTLENLELLRPSLSDNAAVVLDDIRWNRDMYKAWTIGASLPEFNYAVDFGRMGILFKVNNHSPKQYFTIL